MQHLRQTCKCQLTCMLAFLQCLHLAAVAPFPALLIHCMATCLHESSKHKQKLTAGNAQRGKLEAGMRHHLKAGKTPMLIASSRIGTAEGSYAVSFALSCVGSAPRPLPQLPCSTQTVLSVHAAHVALITGHALPTCGTTLDAACASI